MIGLTMRACTVDSAPLQKRSSEKLGEDSSMRLAKTIFMALLATSSIAANSTFAVESDCANTLQTSWPTKDWQSSTPEEQGLDSAALARVVDHTGVYKQDSLLVIRHGKIVLDSYYAPYAPNIRHDLRSITKSFIGTLTAIEVKQGLLDSVNHSIVDLFADKKLANLDDLKKEITVQNMLDMTSGIAWKEDAHTPDDTTSRMYKSADRAEFVLNQPMSDVPGARFYYEGGNPYVLSALVTKETERDALDFARDELFKPLGISSVRWGDADAQRVTDGESGLFLTPRDMAKLGYLYLHNGAWDGQQIIPASWVARVKQGPVTATDGFHYANFWWSLPERDAFMALGRHSQMILVLPKLDIVAVLTGTMKDEEDYPTKGLIDEIAGAIKSDTALVPDVGGQALLAASIQKAATEQASPVNLVPESAKVVSGRVYKFSDNETHLQTISINLLDSNPTWRIDFATQRLDRPTSPLSGPLGLDGLFRKSSLKGYGIDAVKGSWLDDHTFAMERRILGHGETQAWTLVFHGSREVDLTFENTDGAKSKLHGEADE
jgi:CubicO group peptidase (beta-lactamase class C family)